MKNLLLRVTELPDKKSADAWHVAQAQAGKDDAIVIAGDVLDTLPNAAMGRHRPAAWVLQSLAEFPANRTPLFCAAGNHSHAPARRVFGRRWTGGVFQP